MGLNNVSRKKLSLTWSIDFDKGIKHTDGEKIVFSTNSARKIRYSCSVNKTLICISHHIQQKCTDISPKKIYKWQMKT